MKKYKYNLLELNPPDGFRWMKKGERFCKKNFYYSADLNFIREVYTVECTLGRDYPSDDGSGYIIKINEKI